MTRYLCRAGLTGAAFVLTVTGIWNLYDWITWRRAAIQHADLARVVELKARIDGRIA